MVALIEFETNLLINLSIFRCEKNGGYILILFSFMFLEDLSEYDTWIDNIDFKSKHRRFKKISSEWFDKKLITSSFERLINKYKDSILVVSYRSDGILG